MLLSKSSKMIVDVTTDNCGDSEDVENSVIEDPVERAVIHYDKIWVVWSDLKEYLYYLGVKHLLFNACTYNVFARWVDEMSTPSYNDDVKLPTHYSEILYEALRRKMSFYSFDYTLNKEHFLNLLYLTSADPYTDK